MSFPHGKSHILSWHCKKYREDFKKESDVRKHFQNKHAFFSGFQSWILRFQTCMEKTNPYQFTGFLDNPIPLIQNIGSKPLSRVANFLG